MGQSERHIRVVGAMLEGEDGRYLITQRAAKASLPLLWEFPGGRVERGETDEQALRREVRHRLGVDVVVLEQVAETHHAYPHYTVDLRVLRCRLADPWDQPRPVTVNDCRWVTLAELPGYRFPDADARSIAALLGE